ncbi:MAG: hypothetical protein ACXWTW_01570 [Methylobacter sp.]
MQLIKALACQLSGLIIAVLLAMLLPPLVQGAWVVLVIQGLAAAALSRLFRQPLWWLPMHLFFLPAAFSLSLVNLPAGWYLLILAVLSLVFWGTVSGDVPLFVSSPAVADAMMTLVQREQARSFVELGAGIGSVVVPLARSFPLLKIRALERAPLPWLILHGRCRLLPNVAVQNNSLWACDLAEQDLVFAFLSPSVMAQLGEKVRRDMRAGSLFVSSSFPVPDWQPDSVVRLDDRRSTQLYCYRV